MTRTRTTCRALTSIIVALGVSGCATDGLTTMWPNSFMGKAANVFAERVIIPQERTDLEKVGPVGARVANAMALADQGRTAEARYLLHRVRLTQPLGSDGYRSLLASEAVLALREGDLHLFRDLTAQLDQVLDDKVRVEPAWAEVTAIGRYLRGEPLPVNTPQKLRNWISSQSPQRSVALR